MNFGGHFITLGAFLNEDDDDDDDDSNDGNDDYEDSHSSSDGSVPGQSRGV